MSRSATTEAITPPPSSAAMAPSDARSLMSTMSVRRILIPTNVRMSAIVLSR
jgi:hypothetical protein